MVFAAGFLGGAWIAAKVQAKFEFVAQAFNPALHPAENRLVRIVDGDTIVMNYRSPEIIEERIRLLYVDTPERGQSGYSAASSALRELLEGAVLKLEFDDGPRRDRFGRILAYVLADGIVVNVRLVEQGWSPYYTEYGLSTKYDAEFRASEEKARSLKRGRWAK